MQFKVFHLKIAGNNSMWKKIFVFHRLEVFKSLFNFLFKVILSLMIKVQTRLIFFLLYLHSLLASYKTTLIRLWWPSSCENLLESSVKILNRKYFFLSLCLPERYKRPPNFSWNPGFLGNKYRRTLEQKILFVFFSNYEHRSCSQCETANIFLLFLNSLSVLKNPLKLLKHF